MQKEKKSRIATEWEKKLSAQLFCCWRRRIGNRDLWVIDPSDDVKKSGIKSSNKNWSMFLVGDAFDAAGENYVGLLERFDYEILV